MNTDDIRKYCLSFPDSTEKLQWGDALCFKTAGKMFAVLGLDRVRLSFKCAPEAFAELIERENIRPAPYVGRFKWVMLDCLDAVASAELKVLIRQSYEMISAKTPRQASRRTARARAVKKSAARVRTNRHAKKKK